MVDKIRVCTNAKKAMKEYEFLKRDISPGEYKIYEPPLSVELDKSWPFDNNILKVKCFESKNGFQYGKHLLVGEYFRVSIFRDDRDIKDDPATKHINLDKRTLGLNESGEYVTGHCNSFMQHFNYCTSTSMASMIEFNNKNIKILPEWPKKFK